MKDEEMAKEYTTENGFGSDCNHITSYDANKEIEQAFLAGYNKAKEEAKDIINELLMDGYDEYTREKALNFLYPDKEE